MSKLFTYVVKSKTVCHKCKTKSPVTNVKAKMRSCTNVKTKSESFIATYVKPKCKKTYFSIILQNCIEYQVLMLISDNPNVL